MMQTSTILAALFGGASALHMSSQQRPDMGPEEGGEPKHDAHGNECPCMKEGDFECFLPPMFEDCFCAPSEEDCNRESEKNWDQTMIDQADHSGWEEQTEPPHHDKPEPDCECGSGEMMIFWDSCEDRESCVCAGTDDGWIQDLFHQANDAKNVACEWEHHHDPAHHPPAHHDQDDHYDEHEYGPMDPTTDATTAPPMPPLEDGTEAPPPPPPAMDVPAMDGTTDPMDATIHGEPVELVRKSKGKKAISKTQKASKKVSKKSSLAQQEPFPEDHDEHYEEEHYEYHEQPCYYPFHQDEMDHWNYWDPELYNQFGHFGRVSWYPIDEACPVHEVEHEHDEKWHEEEMHCDFGKAVEPPYPYDLCHHECSCHKKQAEAEGYFYEDDCAWCDHQEPWEWCLNEGEFFEPYEHCQIGFMHCGHEMREGTCSDDHECKQHHGYAYCDSGQCAWWTDECVPVPDFAHDDDMCVDWSQYDRVCHPESHHEPMNHTDEHHEEHYHEDPAMLHEGPPCGHLPEFVEPHMFVTLECEENFHDVEKAQKCRHDWSEECHRDWVCKDVQSDEWGGFACPPIVDADQQWCDALGYAILDPQYLSPDSQDHVEYCPGHCKKEEFSCELPEGPRCMKDEVACMDAHMSLHECNEHQHKCEFSDHGHVFHECVSMDVDCHDLGLVYQNEMCFHAHFTTDDKCEWPETHWGHEEGVSVCRHDVPGDCDHWQETCDGDLVPHGLHQCNFHEVGWEGQPAYDTTWCQSTNWECPLQCELEPHDGEHPMQTCWEPEDPDNHDGHWYQFCAERCPIVCPVDEHACSLPEHVSGFPEPVDECVPHDMSCEDLFNELTHNKCHSFRMDLRHQFYEHVGHATGDEQHMCELFIGGFQAAFGPASHEYCEDEPAEETNRICVDACHDIQSQNPNAQEDGGNQMDCHHLCEPETLRSPELVHHVCFEHHDIEGTEDEYHYGEHDDHHEDEYHYGEHDDHYGEHDDHHHDEHDDHYGEHYGEEDHHDDHLDEYHGDDGTAAGTDFEEKRQEQKNELEREMEATDDMTVMANKKSKKVVANAKKSKELKTSVHHAAAKAKASKVVKMAKAAHKAKEAGKKAAQLVINKTQKKQSSKGTSFLQLTSSSAGQTNALTLEKDEAGCMQCVMGVAPPEVPEDPEKLGGALKDINAACAKPDVCPPDVIHHVCDHMEAGPMCHEIADHILEMAPKQEKRDDHHEDEYHYGEHDDQHDEHDGHYEDFLQQKSPDCMPCIMEAHPFSELSPPENFEDAEKMVHDELMHVADMCHEMCPPDALHVVCEEVANGIEGEQGPPKFVQKFKSSDDDHDEEGPPGPEDFRPICHQEAHHIIADHGPDDSHPDCMQCIMEAQPFSELSPPENFEDAHKMVHDELMGLGQSCEQVCPPEAMFEVCDHVADGIEGEQGPPKFVLKFKSSDDAHDEEGPPGPEDFRHICHEESMRIIDGEGPGHLLVQKNTDEDMPECEQCIFDHHPKEGPPKFEECEGDHECIEHAAFEQMFDVLGEMHEVCAGVCAAEVPDFLHFFCDHPAPPKAPKEFLQIKHDVKEMMRDICHDAADALNGEGPEHGPEEE